MKEFIEKLIGRLEEQIKIEESIAKSETEGHPITHQYASNCLKLFRNQVNQLAEEYNQENDDTDYANIELYAFWQKHQWIPCSERLPNESERWLGHDIIDAEPREFIVMVKGAYEPTTGYYTVDGWVKDIYNKEEYGYADEIIAWMPLPEPFKPISE